MGRPIKNPKEKAQNTRQSFPSQKISTRIAAIKMLIYNVIFLKHKDLKKDYSRQLNAGEI